MSRRRDEADVARRAEVAADPDVLDREVDGSVRVDAGGALVVDDEPVVPFDGLLLLAASQYAVSLIVLVIVPFGEVACR